MTMILDIGLAMFSSFSQFLMNNLSHTSISIIDSQSAIEVDVVAIDQDPIQKMRDLMKLVKFLVQTCSIKYIPYS